MNTPFLLNDTTILIVAENNDFRENLINNLSLGNRVLAAENGEIAMKILERQIPDFILLDIILPYTLHTFSILHILKETPQLNSIPVILLSDFRTEEIIKEGLEMGANDYIFKPFHINELILKAKDLLELRNDYSIVMQNAALSKKYPSQVLDMNTNFKHKFEQLAESAIDKEDLSIVSIAEKMMMSVSTLERWTRKAFGVPPRKYILHLKLTKAEILLRQSNSNIKDVAYALGFNSVPYFCLCFKKKYGNSPKAFTRQKQVMFSSIQQTKNTSSDNLPEGIESSYDD